MNNTTEFLQEVDEYMRYERMTNLWKRFRVPFMLVVALMFVAVAAWQYYGESKEASLQSQAEIYWSIAENKDITNIQTLAEKGSVGFSLLAKFTMANNFMENAEMEKAAKIYHEVKADKALKPVYRELAKFYEAQALMEINPENSIKMFEELSTKGSAFRASAYEMLGHLYENMGDNIRAIENFEMATGMEYAPSGVNKRSLARIEILKSVVSPTTGAAKPFDPNNPFANQPTGMEKIPPHIRNKIQSSMNKSKADGN